MRDRKRDGERDKIWRKRESLKRARDKSQFENYNITYYIVFIHCYRASLIQAFSEHVIEPFSSTPDHINLHYVGVYKQMHTY